MRLWLDTDIGRNPDDAVAVLVAAAHPDVELAGISIVGDDPPRQAEAARALLCWAGQGEVPVVLPAAAAGALAAAGVEAVVAIGPLDNIAAALGAGTMPDRLVIMGGALQPVEHRGTRHRVEWNFSRNPKAAAATLAGAAGCTLVPLDATVATRLDPDQVGALVGAAPPLRPMIDAWLAGLAAQGVPPDVAAVHLHDPAAVLVAAGDGPLIGAGHLPVHLAVEADGRLVGDPAARAIDVVVALDGPAVGARVLTLLEGTNRAPGR